MRLFWGKTSGDEAAGLVFEAGEVEKQKQRWVSTCN